MAYTKTAWKDRVIQKPNTFQVQNNPDGTITLIPVPGTITEKGTPVNASNLNKIEDAIFLLDSNKVDKIAGKGLSTNDYDNAAKAEVAKVKDKADTTYVDSIAIVESGSNTNGFYIKYGDGTMVCYYNKAYGAAMTTPSGALYTTSALNWTFPKAFTNYPTCSITSKASSVRVFAQVLDTYKYDSVDFSLIGTTSANLESIIIEFIAIGRWK